ncbi:cation diffusion facilitator family transporter [Halobellus limi]|jgi:cation diffusion facilitator family transporter|uniref:Cation diffusion facilitator family transporter n=1 Tax=Halobellus limi TaxID=699433 RepID=A0A1H5VJK2_9EURY|nr:cation diffusion facilitator family transporter [Halobellus limi]QCC46711.1 cation diffusion facilitator family transporter [Halobellus limi]SEF86727.1 cation diffusion facilitator family transporter [Halobellus limi]
MAGSKGVVLAALFANGAIAIMKFGGFLLTGSPSMLSETYHSISDTGNQIFLLVGIRFSEKESSREHPFGYGKAQFFYSFLVAVLLFGIAGWESAKHGYNAIVHGGHGAAGTITLAGATFPSWYVNVVVLLGAIGFETYALSKANAEMQRQIDHYGWSGIREAFDKMSDVTTLTAFTEDTIALLGAALALVGILLSKATGNEVYDAVAALLIGFMLMGFALALAWENKRLILGESLPADVEADLRDVVTGTPRVVHLDTFRTVYVGPQTVLVTMDVSFDPQTEAGDIDGIISDIEDRLLKTDDRIQHVYVEPEV